MWESYEKYSKECGVEYDDNIVLDSISRTYSIAHNRIQTFLPDNTVRLPDCLCPRVRLRTTLAILCVAGAKEKLADKPNYVERLKYEVNVIEEREGSVNTLTMKRSQKNN